MGFTERVDAWRTFRETLKDTDSLAILNNTAAFWADAPLGARSLDFYTPQDWPDPWEILHNGSFCQNSITLLIYYTLSLSDADLDLKIVLVDDTNDRYLILQVDGTYILNYELGITCKWKECQDNLKVIDIYDETDIKQIV